MTPRKTSPKTSDVEKALLREACEMRERGDIPRELHTPIGRLMNLAECRALDAKLMSLLES